MIDSDGFSVKTDVVGSDVGYKVGWSVDNPTVGARVGIIDGAEVGETVGVVEGNTRNSFKMCLYDETFFLNS